MEINATTTELEGDHGLDIARRLARLSPAQRAQVEARFRASTVDGHALVARTLARLGTTHVYGVPGQPVYDTFAACSREGMRLIGTHHQHPAALMACAHNYFAGRQTAVSLVSTGVPTANAVGAAVVARDNCWPLVVLAGSVPLAAGDSGYFMALDAVQLFSSISKRAMRAAETRAIPECIATAFDIAMSGRPGPVLVELPEDVLCGLARDVGHEPHAGDAQREAPNMTQVREVAAALTSARRPLLIAGKGIRWGSLFSQLRELVDELQIPFSLSPIARGAIADDHPLCMTAIQGEAQSQADLVLLLGARLDWNLRYGSQIAPDAAVIQVDIDAGELSRSARTGIGIHADVCCFLRALLEQLSPAQRAHARDRRDRDWLDALHRSRVAVGARREGKASLDSHRISPMRFARELRDALPRDAITIFDSNLTMAACERMIPAHVPVSRLTPGTSGCLGIGIPYAIAAKLAFPSRSVVAICGDFAFGLSAMELETAVRHAIPIVVVIANNDGNGGSLRERMHMSNAPPQPVMMYQPGLRYDMIAQIFGGQAQHVENADDLGPSIARAIASNRPACINVAVDPNAPFPSD